MSKSDWSGLQGKRFDFSAFKSAGKTEYLIAGGLGLVILVAAYLTIRQVVPEKPRREEVTPMYWCDPNGTPKGCGNVFSKNMTDLLKEVGPVRDPFDEIKTLKIDCPKCHAKNSCWQEAQCPNCKKWYVTNMTRAKYAAIRSRREAPMNIPDICSWCKTDVNKWNIEHRPQ
jgi:hypothetical protein